MARRKKQKILLAARPAKVISKGSKGDFIDAPDDLVKDPRYGVPVSRFGQYGPRRHSDDVIRTTVLDHDGEPLPVMRFRGGLARMRSEGTINDDMLIAGAEFQRHFEICGYGHYTTVNLEGTGRGSGGLDEHMERTAESRHFVNDCLKVVGWPDTHMGKAAWWIVGVGLGLEEIASRSDLHELQSAGDKKYWRGMIVAALEVLSLHLTQKNKGRGKTGQIRGERRFDDGDMTVREGFIHMPEKRKT
ncbi:MAG: hypothetical protein WBK55_08165 [Alphaproteobacteria bacterium]